MLNNSSTSPHRGKLRRCWDLTPLGHGTGSRSVKYVGWHERGTIASDTVCPAGCRHPELTYGMNDCGLPQKPLP